MYCSLECFSLRVPCLIAAVCRGCLYKILVVRGPNLALLLHISPNFDAVNRPCHSLPHSLVELAACSDILIAIACCCCSLTFKRAKYS